MRRGNLAAVAVAVAAAVLGTVGCTTDEPGPEVGRTEQELIGGFRAPGTALNAVGTVGMKDFTGRYQFLCSATLIAPSVVLTAKHCAMVISGELKGVKLVNVTPVFFAVGPDATRPIKLVEAIASELSPVDLGGMAGLGNDVATYQLAAPITDVTPIPVAEVAFTAQDLGKRHLAIGYGTKDLFEDVNRLPSGQRRTGYLTLRALAAKPVQVVYGNRQALVDDLLFRGLPPESLPFVQREIDRLWESSLLESYEVWAGLDSTMKAADGTTDVQPCHGDSGGPLLATIGGQRQIMGVASAVLFSRQLTCDRGAFYGTIAAKTREMIAAALAYRDPCTGATVQGTCDGTVATRCTGKLEGDRRLSRVDCSDLGQVCRQGRDGIVGCFDENDPIEIPPGRPDAGAGPGAGAGADAGRTPPPGGSPRPPTVEEMRAMIRDVWTGKLEPSAD